MLNLGQLVSLQLQKKNLSRALMWADSPTYSAARMQAAAAPLASPQSRCSPPAARVSPLHCSCPTVIHEHCWQAGPTLPPSLSAVLDLPLQAASWYQFNHYNSRVAGSHLLLPFPSHPILQRKKDICYQSTKNSVFVSRYSPWASCHHSLCS